MALDSADARRQTKSTLTAVVPLFGALSMHGSWFTTSTKEFADTVRKLDANPTVSAILIHCNSPGGSVSGTCEAADSLYAVRQRGATRTVAFAEPMMASAALWICSAAGEVVCSPSSEIGSIGVLSAYLDESGLLAKEGIAITIERVPAGKARFSGCEPLDDAMRATMRQRNAEAYQEFVGAMSRNRGVSTSHVVTRFGAGEMLSSREAVAVGLADRVATFDECLAGVMSGQRTSSRRRAETSSAAARLRKLALLEVE